MCAAMSNGDTINVLFVIIQMRMGGAERLLYNLVSRLDRSLFAPSVAWFAEGQPLTEFEDLEIPLYYVPKRRRLDWDAMEELGRIIRCNNVHVVNAHHFMP